MNIRDYWPLNPPEVLAQKEWEEMVQHRLETFQGFARIEESRGFIKVKVNLSTAYGQETLRLLAFRVLEELGEAHLSTEKDHYYEELIDAFNYLLSMTFIEGKVDPKLIDQLVASTPVIGKHPSQMNFSMIGYITVELGGRLGDYLRNRPWMNNVQNTFFDGDLVSLIKTSLEQILSLFPSQKIFYQYFMGKDNVLQFRLRSKY